MPKCQPAEIHQRDANLQYSVKKMHIYRHILVYPKQGSILSTITDIEVEAINQCNDDGVLIRDRYSIVGIIQESTRLHKRCNHTGMLNR